MLTLINGQNAELNSPNTSELSTFRQSISYQIPTNFKIAKRDIVISRRVVFRYLPIFGSNDLVAGSWLFVYGSILFMLISLIPIISINSPYWPKESLGDFTNAELIIMALLFVISGLLFAVGSYAFVRALREHEDKSDPLWGCCRHTSTDELLGAWLYFLAMVPYPPYIAFYISKTVEDSILWIALAISLIVLYAMYLFVLATYPNYATSSSSPAGPSGLISSMSAGKQQCSCLPSCLRYVCGRKTGLAKHVQNDWLLGCWIFLIGSGLITIAIIARAIQSALQHTYASTILYALDALDFLVFTIGCAYFCAGSYPQQHVLSVSSETSSFGSLTQAGFSPGNAINTGECF